MRCIALAGLLAVALAGCANVPAPATTVAGAEEALTAADQVAIKYVTLPQCPPTGGTDGLTCSQAATIVTIKADAQQAHDLIKAAEATAAAGGTPVMTDINIAIAALQAAFPPAATKS
ncbi:MAG TPA: hypothetical protein VGL95_14765 [Acetobacteraceae bacterium]